MIIFICLLAILAMYFIIISPLLLAGAVFGYVYYLILENNKCYEKKALVVLYPFSVFALIFTCIGFGTYTYGIMWSVFKKEFISFLNFSLDFIPNFLISGVKYTSYVSTTFYVSCTLGLLVGYIYYKIYVRNNYHEKAKNNGSIKSTYKIYKIITFPYSWIIPFCRAKKLNELAIIIFFLATAAAVFGLFGLPFSKYSTGLLASIAENDLYIKLLITANCFFSFSSAIYFPGFFYFQGEIVNSGGFDKLLGKTFDEKLSEKFYKEGKRREREEKMLSDMIKEEEARKRQRKQAEDKNKENEIISKRERLKGRSLDDIFGD